MQRVYTVWDDGLNPDAYREVNAALRQGSTVVSMSTAATGEPVTGPNPQVGRVYGVTVFVLELPEDDEGS